MNDKIAQVVVGLPIEGPFDYLIEDSQKEKIAIGMRVSISFGQRKLLGFVVGFKKTSSYKKLKSILALIDDFPAISPLILKLTKEFAGYYGCSWGEAIEASLPAALRKSKSAALSCVEDEKKSSGAPGECLLLHDQSREKRWSFLIDTVEKTLSEGKGVLFLVPEVFLVEDVYKRFIEKFPEGVVILDKKVSAKKELEEWLKIKEGRARIVIGTRSAVFAPVKNLGLIVLYDEENNSYKQEQSPFYHARQVAMWRVAQEGAGLIFASQAPSVETWYLTQKKKIKIVSLKSEWNIPAQIVDMSNYRGRGDSLLSFPLRNGLQKTLEARGKAILFMNRKGFSTTTRCQQCGHTLKCKHCDANLTYLFGKKKMVCRHCSYTITPPSICPQCQGSYLRYTGMGTEKLESEVARLFPQARIGRFDRDSKILPESFDILIATQAILRFKNKLSVSLVGVLRIDTELNRMDFKSGHNVFALLVHLKDMAREKMIIQTGVPDNYSIETAAKMDFKEFYRTEIKFRREIGFPPFQHLTEISLRGPKEDILLGLVTALHNDLVASNKGKGIDILDPQPGIIPKLRDKYRFSILIKGKSQAQVMSLIQKSLKSFKKKSGMIISINVDP